MFVVRSILQMLVSLGFISYKKMSIRFIFKTRVMEVTMMREAPVGPTPKRPLFRPSYFTPASKTPKMDARREVAAAITEKVRVGERQIALMEEAQRAKERRDQELHELVVAEKNLDIKIKAAQLRLLEKQLL